jgi:hypothetical protein
MNMFETNCTVDDDVKTDSLGLVIIIFTVISNDAY